MVACGQRRCDVRHRHCRRRASRSCHRGTVSERHVLQPLLAPQLTKFQETNQNPRKIVLFVEHKKQRTQVLCFFSAAASHRPALREAQKLIRKKLFFFRTVRRPVPTFSLRTLQRAKGFFVGTGVSTVRFARSAALLTSLSLGFTLHYDEAPFWRGKALCRMRL